VIPNVVVVPSPEPDELQAAEVAESDQPAAEAAAEEKEKPKPVRMKHENYECEGWLHHLLLDAPGSELAIEDIRAAGAERGYSDRLLRHSASKIGVTKINLNGRPVAWRLELDPKDASPEPPRIVNRKPIGPFTLADIQRVFDAVRYEYGKPIDTRGMHPQIAYESRMLRRKEIENELKRRLEPFGFTFPEFNDAGDNPLTNPAAAIANGGRPLATLDRFPTAVGRAVDMRSEGLRQAEAAHRAAQDKAAEAKVALDRERAGAAT
jgi:hypothetical protein